MSSTPTVGELAGRQFLTDQRQKQVSAAEATLPEMGVVTAVSGDYIAARSNRANSTQSTTLLARVSGPTPAIGDPVVLIPILGGGYVAAVIGGGTLRVEAATALQKRKVGALDFGASFTLVNEDAIGVDTDIDEVNIDLAFPTGGASGTSLAPARADHWHVGSHAPGGGFVPSGGTRALYLTGSYTIGPLSNVTLTANRVYYVPVWLANDITVDSFLVNISTLVAGQIQLGIYDNLPATFLPGNRIAVGTKTNYGASGFKVQSVSSFSLAGGTWYWMAVCSVTAHGITGSQVATDIPALRGVDASTGVANHLMMFEDLTAGWTNIPATATPGGLANTYLHIGARAS